MKNHFLLFISAIHLSRNSLSYFLAELRKLAKMDGFADLYIMLSTGDGTFTEYKNWGGDALVEYQPLRLYKEVEFENVVPEGYLNPKFKGNIVDISKALKNKQYLCKYEKSKYYRCALTLWDNCARKKTIKCSSHTWKYARTNETMVDRYYKRK